MTIKEFDYKKHLGQTVRVYRNLHNGLFSVLTKQDKGWRLAGHVSQISLCSVHFIVSEAGRQRVLKTGKKDIHAYMQGCLTTNEIFNKITENSRLVEVRYNPYKTSKFMSFYDAEEINFTFLVKGWSTNGNTTVLATSPYF